VCWTIACPQRLQRQTPGEYHLRVHSGDPPQFFVAERKLLVDGGAAIDGVEIALDFSAGSVSGRALDQAGNSIPDARVVLQSVERRSSALTRILTCTVPQLECTRSQASRREGISFSRGEVIRL